MEQNTAMEQPALADTDTEPLGLLDLPNVLLIEILEYCSYDEVAKKRLVCSRFDQICQHILNRGFNKAIAKHSRHFKRIKSVLPRRESNRRTHNLARHCDILTSVETRLSMLTMTYTKYIDLKLCCFIPGRVLDEIFRILRVVEKPDRHLRPHEVLQELRDISSMAIEHFDENITATLKPFWEMETRAEAKRVSAANAAAQAAGCSNSAAYETMCQRINTLVSLGEQSNLGKILRKGVSPENASGGAAGGCTTRTQLCRDGNAVSDVFDRLEIMFRKGMAEINNMARLQKRQQRHLQKTNQVVTELNTQVSDMKKRFEDVDAKNQELLAKINQIYNGEQPSTSADAATAAIATSALVAIDGTPLGSAAKRRHDDNDPASSATPTLEPLPLPPLLSALTGTANALGSGDMDGVTKKKPKF